MMEYDVFDAIKANDLTVLKTFADTIGTDGGAWSPLHEAAKRGRTELLEFISQQRFVDINADFEVGEPDDFRNGTALTEALLNGHVGTAVYLIQQGASVNAGYYGYENTHCLGLEFEESGTCLTLAIEIGNDQLLQIMIEHGLDPDALFHWDHRDMTAFAYYLERANIDAMQKLFDIGAGINALIKDEWQTDVRPLMQAVYLYCGTKQGKQKNKRLAIVDWFLRHGCDLGFIHEDSELPTVLSVVMEAKDSELNKVFGLISSVDDD